MEISVLKNNAKEQLSGKWGLTIVTLLVGTIIMSGFSSVVGFIEPESNTLKFFGTLINILFGGVITLGISKFTLNIATNKEKASFQDLFSGFNIYLKTLGLWIAMGVCIGIGTLLFIVPGIIVALMFSQAFFILCEDNQKSITECLKESSKIMKGYKGSLFNLEFSFIGWWLLAAITFGIGALYVYPYLRATTAEFYLELKNRQGLI
jgi:uncharacterized membrane protein